MNVLRELQATHGMGCTGVRYCRADSATCHVLKTPDKSHTAHLFMDMLTRLMMTLTSTRSALRADRRPSHL